MFSQRRIFLAALVVLSAPVLARGVDERPNILFLFSDDHAIKSISAYGGPLADVAPTPNIDRLAREGAVFLNSFCANSICGPSRATILTGKHSHKNGFMRNTGKGLDQSQWTVSKALQKSGYTTAVVGKWHLKTTPQGFDHWEIFPGQGSYYNPVFIQMDNSQKRFDGYATDLTTDKAISWLDDRDKSRPFFLMCQHKAPHRTFAPALRHLGAFDDIEIPEPENLFDDYANRSATLAKNEMEIDRHFDWAYDAKVRKDERGDVKLPKPDRYGTPEYNRMTPAQKKVWDAHFGPRNQEFLADFGAGKLKHRDLVRWKYRRYMRNYLSTVKAVDESVGRMLKYLDDNNLADNTIVIYSSDQGFYLGEHGWYDKRFMYEESLRMPFVIRYPREIAPGGEDEHIILNTDFAATFLDYAGLEPDADMQSESFRGILSGDAPENWREIMYYRYYRSHFNTPSHWGVRTKQYKYIYYNMSDEHELYDLSKDSTEMKNLCGDPEYRDVADHLKAEVVRLQAELDDTDDSFQGETKAWGLLEEPHHPIFGM